MSSQSTDSLYHQARHPIGVVIRRTGLKPDVLRAWEKRYSAVSPARSSGNRRVYSDADIEKLLFLRQAIEGGRRISQVAQFNHAELEELVVADRSATPHLRTRQDVVQKANAEQHLAACLWAVQELEAGELAILLERAAVDLSQPQLMEGVLVPLMEEVGEQWDQGSLRVAHEHMACAVTCSFLSGLPAGCEVPEGAPQLVVATPVRQFHEVGARMVAATAASLGWCVTYLGTSLSAEEIAAAASRRELERLLSALFIRLMTPSCQKSCGSSAAIWRILSHCWWAADLPGATVKLSRRSEQGICRGLPNWVRSSRT